MVPPLTTDNLLRESSPVAVILLFWVALASLATSTIATGLLGAGLIMALLYTIVRGVALAETRQAASQPDDLSGILLENVRVALPAGVWFLVARLVSLLEWLLVTAGVPSSVTSLVADAPFAFVGAGVAVVLLYAISTGLTRVGNTAPNSGNDVAGVAPAVD